MAVDIKPRDKKIKRSPVHRIILLALGIVIISALVIFINLFNYILKPNIKTGTGEPVSLYIPSGASYTDVKDLIYSQGIVISRKSFEWVAKRKNYQNHVKPGHYIISNSMNNNSLVNMLRSGAQAPVKVTFNNMLNKEELAGRISAQLEPDSVSFLRCWNDREYLKSLNTTPGKVFMLFLPDTYELWWTTDAKVFTERMAKESRKFWEGERTKKAGNTGLSVEEVIILASIIEKETQKNDEKPSIAGVYINRLKKGWPLQADPTVKYALGAFNLKRVLKVHTEYDSPYNTYLYKGLPPGPICMPSKSSIDAVLDYKKHNYMFFCAKADMSGYHAFSRTLAEHNRYASAYQNELNRRKIR